MKWSRGVIVCGTYGLDPYIVGRENDPPQVPQQLRRIKDAVRGGHEKDWARACRESKENRTEPSSNFEYSAPLNELVVMGNLAVRLQDLKRVLQWDAKNMRIPNIDEKDEIRVVTTDTFQVVDGDPRFNTEYATINAKAAAEQYIRRSYRNGWSY